MSCEPMNILVTRPRCDRQVMWDKIRCLHVAKGEFIRRDLLLNLPEHASKEVLKGYLMALEKAGIIQQANRKKIAGVHSPVRVYHLVDDCGVEAPKLKKDGTRIAQGSATEQMWRTMRILRIFTHMDLATQASTEEFPVKYAHAKDYLNHLLHAGYLQCLEKDNGQRKAVYRLLPHKNTGPIPPIIERTHWVFDPNLQEVVWPISPEHLGAQA